MSASGAGYTCRRVCTKLERKTKSRGRRKQKGNKEERCTHGACRTRSACLGEEATRSTFASYAPPLFPEASHPYPVDLGPRPAPSLTHHCRHATSGTTKTPSPHPNSSSLPSQVPQRKKISAHTKQDRGNPPPVFFRHMHRTPSAPSCPSPPFFRAPSPSPRLGASAPLAHIKDDDDAAARRREGDRNCAHTSSSSLSPTPRCVCRVRRRHRCCVDGCEGRAHLLSMVSLSSRSLRSPARPGACPASFSPLSFLRAYRIRRRRRRSVDGVKAACISSSASTPASTPSASVVCWATASAASAAASGEGRAHVFFIALPLPRPWWMSTWDPRKKRWDDGHDGRREREGGNGKGAKGEDMDVEKAEDKHEKDSVHAAPAQEDKTHKGKGRQCTNAAGDVSQQICTNDKQKRPPRSHRAPGPRPLHTPHRKQTHQRKQASKKSTKKPRQGKRRVRINAEEGRAHARMIPRHSTVPSKAEKIAKTETKAKILTGQLLSSRFCFRATAAGKAHTRQPLVRKMSRKRQIFLACMRATNVPPKRPLAGGGTAAAADFL
ncbi:hypothetical protein C8R45DRAFT_1125100 [Mycena sanguinolenta]|nr:hypothetical protein C8R45DRAFT_1125100 [Mycena sanguinolenta]